MHKTKDVYNSNTILVRLPRVCYLYLTYNFKKYYCQFLLLNNCYRLAFRDQNLIKFGLEILTSIRMVQNFYVIVMIFGIVNCINYTKIKSQYINKILCWMRAIAMNYKRTYFFTE